MCLVGLMVRFIVTKAREDALDKILAWLDRGKTAGALSKQKKRPTAEVNQDNFTERAENDYREEKFKGVWKDATNTQISGTKKGKRGFGAVSVASKYNKHLLSPNDRKIRAQTFIDSVAPGGAPYPHSYVFRILGNHGQVPRPALRYRGVVVVDLRSVVTQIAK
mmetsp:Transcript_3186/g.5790  ORF Transcript_3186/g.5790 Transcript_3186/m.5790 type:complete len:164 (+) Transcript_3186:322-813(+)